MLKEKIPHRGQKDAKIPRGNSKGMGLEPSELMGVGGLKNAKKKVEEMQKVCGMFHD